MPDMANRGWHLFNARKTLQAWLAVYPCVLLFLAMFGRQLAHWPLPLRLLLSTAMIVPVVVNITAPLVERSIDWLLRVSGRHGTQAPAEQGKEEQP